MPGSSTPNGIRSDADVDHDEMFSRTHDGDNLGAANVEAQDVTATESAAVPVTFQARGLTEIGWTDGGREGTGFTEIGFTGGGDSETGVTAIGFA